MLFEDDLFGSTVSAVRDFQALAEGSAGLEN